MAVSYVTNALGSTSATTSFSVTLPTTQSGDILILEYTHRGTTDATLGGTSISSGGLTWAEKHDRQYASSTFSGKTVWTRATGNHSGQTITGTGLTNSCAAIVTVYRGALTSADPLTDATIIGEENASGNETQAEITTTTDGAYVVLVVANSPDVAVTSQSCTSPGALSARAEVLSTGGTDTSISHASAEKVTAGATGAFTWAQTDGASGSWAYAIKPQPVAITQAAFRYYEDGTETGSTAIDAQDTNITRDVTSDSNLQLRVRLQETNGIAAASTDDYQLQYSLNSGTYYNIGAGGAPSGSPSLLTSYDTSNQSSTASIFMNNSTQQAVGESIQGDDKCITSVKWYIYNNGGTATGKVRAKVYATTGSHGTNATPTGAALAQSAEIDVTTLGTSFSALSEFFFTGADSVVLTSGVTYVVSVEVSTIGTGTVIEGYDTTPAYAGNGAKRDGSGVWSTGGLGDFVFYLYTDVSNSPVLNFNSASLTDGNATTNRLGSGSGSFVAGEISEDGLVDNSQLTASNYTEHLYSLTLASAALANNDTLDFRVLRNSATTGMTYTVTPRITASKGGGTPSPNVSDSTTLSESRQLEVNSSVSKSDTAATTESTTVAVASQASVSDSIAITESAQLLVTGNVTVSDSTTASESLSILLPFLMNSVSDTVGTSESVKSEVTGFISTSDTAAVADTVSLAIASTVNTSDTVGTAESQQLEITSFVSKSDSTTLSESLTILLPTLYVGTSDSASLSEALQCLVENRVATSDSSDVAENTQLQVTVTASVSDTVTTAESIKLLNEANPVISDSAALSESVSVTVVSGATPIVAVSDTASLTEVVLLEVTNFVSTSDASALTEAQKLELVSFITKSDTATASEALSLLATNYITVNDATTATESSTLLIPVLYLSVSDSAAVAESVTVALEAQGLVQSDAVTTSEATTLLIPDLHVTQSDTATVAEALQLVVVSDVRVSDGATLTESLQVTKVDPGAPLSIVVSDVVGSRRSQSIIFLTDGRVAIRLSNNLYLPL